MLTNFLKNSKPIQNVFLILLFLIIFTIYSLFSLDSGIELFSIIKVILNFFLLLSTAFIIKLLLNDLSLYRGSNFFAYTFICFLCFHPNLMTNINIGLATFLSTFGIYRFLKIDFSENAKLSVFDASLFIFSATIFHFWAIIYSILIFFVSLKNFKKNNNIFLVPVVAFFTVTILFYFLSLLINPKWIYFLYKNSSISFNFSTFESIYSRIIVSFYFSIFLIILFFIFFQIPKKPLVVQSTIRKIIYWLFLSVIIFVITPIKTNDLLIFTSIPLLIITSNFIEYSKDKLLKEIILVTLSLFGLLFFVLQTFF